MINAKNIEVSFGKHNILKGVDINASDKKFIGIIGPNGSGKSTLLKCIYRVLEPDSGTIFLDEKSINNYSYKESAKKIAVVAQHNDYSFEFEVINILLMGRAPHKKLFDRDKAEDFEIAKKALKTVGLEGYKDRSFSTLSGGERQRVILARALCQETDILILDEPTNHLDINYQIQLMNVLKTLDKTIISAIHDLNIAAIYCDEIYVMKSGKIFAHGKPEEVLTADLINEVYGVYSQVFKDKNGYLRILFSPEMKCGDKGDI